jgi:hypothetical protein
MGVRSAGVAKVARVIKIADKNRNIRFIISSLVFNKMVQPSRCEKLKNIKLQK